MTTILACVGGRITESACGCYWEVCDHWTDRRVTIDAADGRSMLATFNARWPRAEYLDAIRYILGDTRPKSPGQGAYEQELTVRP